MHEKMQTNETMLVFVYVQGGVKKLNNNVFSALSFLASVCVCLEFVHSFFSTPLLSLSVYFSLSLRVSKIYNSLRISLSLCHHVYLSLLCSAFLFISRYLSIYLSV